MIGHVSIWSYSFMVIGFCKLQDKFHSFHPVATILSYLTKAPLVSSIPLLLIAFASFFGLTVTSKYIVNLRRQILPVKSKSNIVSNLKVVHKKKPT